MACHGCYHSGCYCSGNRQVQEESRCNAMQQKKLGYPWNISWIHHIVSSGFISVPFPTFSSNMLTFQACHESVPMAASVLFGDGFESMDVAVLPLGLALLPGCGEASLRRELLGRGVDPKGLGTAPRGG